MSVLERVPITGEGWTFSEAVAVHTSTPGRWVHIAGQAAVDPAAGMAAVAGGEATVPTDMEYQANAIFDRVASHLAKFGGDLSHVVRMTVYLTSWREFKVFSRIRGERFAGNYPTSTAIQVAGLLGGIPLEIDAVAFIPDA